MATGKFIVPEHDHYLSTIRSCAEAQKVLKNYKYANFDQISKCFSGQNQEDNLISYLNSISSIFKPDVSEEPEDHNYTVNLQFSSFNNLYEEYCTLWSVMMLERYERIKEVKEIRTTPATNDNLGMVKLSADSTESGLSLDSSGSIFVNYGQVQSKLESGKNIKYIQDIVDLEPHTVSLIQSDSDKSSFIHLATINGKSLIVDNPNDKDSVKDLSLVTTDDFNIFKVAVTGGSTTTLATVSDSIIDLRSNVDDFKTNLVTLQKQLMNVIADIQAGIGNINGSGGVSGSVICPPSVPVCHTCDNITLTKQDSYYIKISDEGLPFDGCVADDADYWFQFNTGAVDPVTDHSTLKFILEIRMDGSQQDESVLLSNMQSWKFPWQWSKNGILLNETGSNKYSIIPEGSCVFQPNTVNLIEITGIWKCDVWNFFGTLIDSYVINCSASDSDQESESEPDSSALTNT